MILGPFIRNIRIQKGMSQAEVCADIITQSNYSKFELGKIDISASALINIINNLEISFDEFFYLYEIEFKNSKNDFLNNFFHITFNQPDQLIKIREEAKSFLKKSNSENSTIQDIIMLCYALESISKEKNYETAIKYADPIWLKLQNRDRWYAREIMLLNSILYIFPLDTADEIINRSYKFLEDYNNHHSYSSLKINLSSNGALLHIRSKSYEKALFYIEKVISFSKRIDHEVLKKMAQFRKCYCRAQLNKTFAEDLPEVIMYFTSINKQFLIDALKSESEKYCSNPEFLQKVIEIEKQIKEILG